MEGAGALAVQAEVLGEGLRDAEFEAEGDEVADGPGVVGEGAGGEALVGAVEEGEEFSRLHDRGDLFPLGLRGVDAGGVVGAGVEEDDAAGGSGGEGGEHGGEIEHFCRRVEVGVVGEGEGDVGEYLVVIGPGGGRDIDGLVGGAGEEFAEEEGAEVDGAGAGDGLQGCYLGFGVREGGGNGGEEEWWNRGEGNGGKEKFGKRLGRGI